MWLLATKENLIRTLLLILTFSLNPLWASSLSGCIASVINAKADEKEEINSLATRELISFFGEGGTGKVIVITGLRPSVTHLLGNKLPTCYPKSGVYVLVDKLPKSWPPQSAYTRLGGRVLARLREIQISGTPLVFTHSFRGCEGFLSRQGSDFERLIAAHLPDGSPKRVLGITPALDIFSLEHEYKHRLDAEDPRMIALRVELGNLREQGKLFPEDVDDIEVLIMEQRAYAVQLREMSLEESQSDANEAICHRHGNEFNIERLGDWFPKKRQDIRYLFAPHGGVYTNPVMVLLNRHTDTSLIDSVKQIIADYFEPSESLTKERLLPYKFIENYDPLQTPLRRKTKK